jgi:hypothetical protein
MPCGRARREIRFTVSAKIEIEDAMIADEIPDLVRPHGAIGDALM